MNSYGEGYFNVMSTVSHDFLGQYNLNLLSTFEKKIQCYQRFQKDPHQYYDCFVEVEGKREEDAKQLTSAYSMVEEQYKLCSEGCKVRLDDVNCQQKCSGDFSNKVRNLYKQFYQSRVGGRKQFKSVKAK